GVLRVPVDRPATDRDLLGPVGAPGLADQFRVYAADLGRTVGRQRRPRHRAVTGAVRDVLYLVVLGEQVQRHAVLVGHHRAQPVDLCGVDRGRRLIAPVAPVARHRRGRLAAGRGDRVPGLADALSLRVAFRGVLGVVVKRPAADGDLLGTVGAGD